jgi:putative FmdB family regulatory protein
MPTYEYTCRQCEEHLEVVQAFTDDTLTTCPNCGGDLKKVFGNIGIVFKGSGFYKTDSRSGSAASKTSSTESPATAGSESKSESTKDSPAKDSPAKSDAKSDSAPKPSTTSGSKSTPKPAAVAS